MKLIHIITLSLGLLTGIPASWAQGTDGNGYFLHTVTKGQSLYSIASMYKVSIADIVRLNPGSEEKIRAGEALKIPQSPTSAASSGQRFHTIQAGETLYQLTVKYGITAQAICAANPGLSASNFRIGQVVVIPAESADTTPTASPTAQPAVASAETKTPDSPQKKQWREMHKVQKKETIYSISHQYGITEDELIAANPELKSGKLKKGSFLFIPYPTPQQVEKPAVVPPTNEQLFNANARQGKSFQTIKAALLLPFTGNHSEEQARIVEFYEGFLMAIDSLKRKGVSFDLYTYDTKGTTAGINAALAKPSMKEMDVIFGPVHTASIAPVASFAEKHHIRLVIPFSPKADQVFSNPYIYQINTPQSYLYSEVYEHFIRKFGNSNVIFLDDGRGDKEKSEFIRGLKNELKENHINASQIRLDGSVDGRKVLAAMDTLRGNIFIPTSGTSTALTKLLPHLTLVKREHPHVNMCLFGYPEWQTYTQEFLSTFYELDTYFYSSFYTNNLFPAAIRFTQAYHHWYSKDMGNTFPQYSMLGFDIGYYFLYCLSKWGDKMEQNLNRADITPIQTGFKFERVNNWGGFINRKVFFVHFSKDYELVKLNFD